MREGEDKAIERVMGGGEKGIVKAVEKSIKKVMEL